MTQISDLVESKDSEKLFKDTFCYVVHEELKKQDETSKMLLYGSKESINNECAEQIKSQSQVNSLHLHAASLLLDAEHEKHCLYNTTDMKYS